MTNLDEVAPQRIGNKAPDWGKNYGIRELWSEVAPGLFVGGTHDLDTVDVPRDSIRKMHAFDIMDSAEITPDEFDCVVTMYAWARPVDWGVEELRWGIMDSPTAGVDMESLRETVVWAHRRWKAGKRVLVRCQAGLNRSSLVAGLVLVRDGWSGAEAIDKIRRGRSDSCLFNTKFAGIVRGSDSEFWRN
jgi:hypothetical protein